MLKETYTIAEVSDIIKESHSLLRFWEQRFDFLNPKKKSSGDRIYSIKDLELIKKIHFLVKKRGYTLDGADRFLKKFKYLNVEKTLIDLKEMKTFFQDILSKNS